MSYFKIWLIKKIYKNHIKLKNAFSRHYFVASTSARKVRSIQYPCSIVGGEFTSIQEGLQCGPGFRLEALAECRGQFFVPEIIIGRNVCFGSNCHVGAINRIEIHDHVLVGSNVLITDHNHGNLTKEQLHIPANNRPLHSNGKIIIEQNAWIGDGVSIMPSVVIGRNAVVGTGSVVTSDIPADSICAGVPARIIRQL